MGGFDLQSILDAYGGEPRIATATGSVAGAPELVAGVDAPNLPDGRDSRHLESLFLGRTSILGHDAQQGNREGVAREML